MANVLIIDDDAAMCQMLVQLVENIEHRAGYALTLEDGLALAQGGGYDVVFLDVHMPDGNGLEALTHIRRLDPPPEVVIITGLGDPQGAEIAIKNGAWDYVQKPLSPKKVILPLKRVLEYRDNLKQVRTKPVLFNRSQIIGNSPPLNSCIESLASAAFSDANVLITGETGTGKEVFARALHNNSTRSGEIFVVVDCAALPETLVESTLFGYEKGAFTGADKTERGLIKQADRGTLFLDEVCELSLPLQKAFLRVLQERRFRPIGGKHEVSSNFRLVAATNRKPEEMVAQGLFRKDLLYRLRAIAIELPPLRKRGDDIKDLTLHYTDQIAAEMGLKAKGFAPDFIDFLKSYRWPGNVRELIHTLESTISQAHEEPILFPQHLPQDIRIQMAQAALSHNSAPPSLSPTPETGNRWMPPTFERLPSYKGFRETTLHKAEKWYFQELVRLARGDVAEACRISGLGRTRLYTQLKKHGISRKYPAP